MKDIEALRQTLPEGSVLTDEHSLALHATDIFWSSQTPPLAVVAPSTEEEVATAVRMAAELGLHVLPRGGGMSYTKGYVAEKNRSIVLDLRRLDRVLSVNADDGYVEVECGCTWATLHAALADTGHSTGYWGPFSGLMSTVGGAVSQNSGGFGSARHGTVGESVLGLHVVLSDGTRISTGSAARTATKPFTRTNGPDITGLFLGDNGAFGVKTRIVLRLRRKSPDIGFLSFRFPSLDRLAAAQCDLARAEAVSASYGFDRLKAALATRSMTHGDGARVLYNIARSGSRVSGVLNAAKAAVTGAGFLDKHPFTLHLTIEEWGAARLSDRRSEILGMMARHGGVELPSTVPQALHSTPFGPLRGMLGPDGERWVPVHGIFPLSAATDVVGKWQDFMAGWKAAIEAHGIQISLLTLTVDRQFFLEPAFYWLDEILPIHHAALGDRIEPEWSRRSPRPEARATVVELRSATQQLFASLGGISWQIARDYPFQEHLHPGYRTLLESIKRAVDTRSIINPGSLGLG